MNEKEQVEFIIQHLGFAGVTQTLRIPKERVQKLLNGADKFSVAIRGFAKKAITDIQLIQAGKPASPSIEILYARKNGAPYALPHVVD